MQLSSDDLSEYNKLCVRREVRVADIGRKASAKSTAVTERQQYDALELDAGTKRDALATANDKLQQAQYKLEKLEAEERTLDARRSDVRAMLGSMRLTPPARVAPHTGSDGA